MSTPAANQLPNYFHDHGDLGVATNGTGNPIYEMDASMTIGKHGPIPLEDWQLLDTLSAFNRERIPERVVHAKGGSAAGVFTCTHDISQYTMANVFSAVGRTTPIRMRFSTVAGNLGASDTVRDPRGFAIKFYTTDGIWDLVGNNTPIFFIRDPIMFPQFIRSQKRNPATHTRDWNSFWDFLSLRQESIHQVMILFSDRGIPDGFRHMHGYGSHTFSLINADGVKTYCKFHFRTRQGIRNIDVARAEQLAGSDPDYALLDLYNAIASGECPSWRMQIQTMSEEQAAQESDFDPFDVTKVWPHAKYPLLDVGDLTLNANPQNYFSEVEQLSFSPASFVPGIGPSQDRMLLGRLFAYHDAHLYRLGVNYKQLPVNQPFRVNDFARDGLDVNDNKGGAPNYHPNSFGGPNEDARYAKFYPRFNVTGQTVRYDTTVEDNVTQPRNFYNSVLSVEERTRLAENIAGTLVHAIEDIQLRTVRMFESVSPQLGADIRRGLSASRKKLNVAI